MNPQPPLHPSLHVYAYSSPAAEQDLAKLASAYSAIPDGYLALARQAVNMTLLWNGRGELRIWGPDEILAMDAAYGASARMPGAMPFADNGGGQWLVYGDGPKGRAVYLVDAGSLDLDEYAPQVCRDLSALLAGAEGADLIFMSDPVDESELGKPVLQDPPRF